MTEKEKMLAGEVYSAVDGQLLQEINAPGRGCPGGQQANLDIITVG